MNTLQPFNIAGEKPRLLNEKKLPGAEGAPLLAPTESPWRRVLNVILVEGQIRYVVESKP